MVCSSQGRMPEATGGVCTVLHTVRAANGLERAERRRACALVNIDEPQRRVIMSTSRDVGRPPASPGGAEVRDG
jgi:hypothetical protein